jgi:hypothetical protein
MVVGLFLIYLRFLHGYIMLPASFHVTDDRYMSPTMVTFFSPYIPTVFGVIHDGDSAFPIYTLSGFYAFFYFYFVL